jgi:hypothetical protein
VLKVLADVTTISQPQFIYLANFGLFLLTNLLVYWRLRDPSVFSARLFLLLSSFNLITLSFANTFLTENTAIFLTAALFYFVTEPKMKWWSVVASGLVGGVFMYARPSAIVLFMCVLLYVCVKAYFMKNWRLIAMFFVGAVLPISIGMINTYNIDQRIALFTKQTQGIYDMQVRQGVVWVKYETSVDKEYAYPTMYYFHNKNQELNKLPCNGAVSCLVTYITHRPLQYVLSLALHVFNIFDRVYLDTYVQHIKGRLPLLALANYVVLTGALLGLFFFEFAKKWREIVTVMFVIAFGLLAIYVPTVVEPRFSAPVFPFMLVLFSFYVEQLLKTKDRAMKIRLLGLQLILILLFFIISDLVDVMLRNGPNNVY